ncbi:endonuclease/exonuclease/phosphatase family protein [Ureaplasma diversum]|uniref:endonuclease/exonuclease/phosphatase family protein n=1 Tax=Ureaplasma diversum TaxID=42094 RepID=UPI000AC7656E|nr:endonuclease/exonuclease/phosphatase family protein [Ureaplasma diversum]
MKLSKKKMLLLFGTILVTSLGVAAAVACTPKNNEPNKSQTQLEQQQQQQQNRQALEQATIVSFLYNYHYDDLFFNLDLTVNTKNLNGKYIEVYLKSEERADDFVVSVSSKAKVVDNKAVVRFNKLNKLNEYTIYQILVFGSKDSINAYKIEDLKHLDTKINKSKGNIENKDNLGSKDQLSNDLNKNKTNPLTLNNSSSNKDKLKSEIAWSSLRVGHWNVLHQDGKDEDKNEALAKVILHHKYDVIGLTEIMPITKDAKQEEKDLAVKKIVDLMNQLSKTNDYSYLISENLAGSENDKLATPEHTSTERIGLIYNKTKAMPVAFANGKIGHVYSNPLVDGKWTKDKVDYSRPPFSVKLQTVGEIKNDFTLIFAHFDSPGKYPKREGQEYEKKEQNYSKEKLKTMGVEKVLKYTTGRQKGKFVQNEQGSRELDDAENITKVIEEVRKIDDNKDDDYFFLGDTNIRLGNEQFAFKSLREAGFTNLLKDDWDYRTTLGINVNKTSNPYDKIFKNSNLETKNANLFVLWNVFKDKILDDEWYKKVSTSNPKAKQWLENPTSFGKPIKITDSKEEVVRPVISDHSPTWFDLVLNPLDIK